MKNQKKLIISGRELLNSLSDEVKNHILERFDSMEKFYSIVYYYSALERKACFSGENSSEFHNKLERLTEVLSICGLEYDEAETVINEITMDESEEYLNSFLTDLLGPHWQGVIDEISARLGI